MTTEKDIKWRAIQSGQFDFHCGVCKSKAFIFNPSTAEFCCTECGTKLMEPAFVKGIYEELKDEAKRS